MSIETYEKLHKVITDIRNNELDKIDATVRKDINIEQYQQHTPEELEKLVTDTMIELSLNLQFEKQQIRTKKWESIKTPHLDDTLRAKWLSEKLRYEQRLQYILSHPQFFAKINPEYLEAEKEKTPTIGKYLNKWAVEARIVKNFIEGSLVIDGTKITQDMQLHLLEWKTTDHDPYYTKIKKHLAHPYSLHYKIPGKVYDRKYPHETTSRITFFRNSPAIGVFRSADTHPIIEDSTKHEQRKITKDMDMYITNSSYDVVTQQYQSIQHITKDKEFMQDILHQLNNLIKDTAFGPDEILQISQTIDAIKNQVNPHTLMARLYNLTKIPYFVNRVVQKNLLFGAINKLQKREKQLGLYAYYMIPQLQRLEVLHNANKQNMETLHRNILMCASGNNPRSFAADKWQEMQQFNKHDIWAKVQRALRQHTISQEDHLIWFFYSMHQQIQTLLKVPNSEEKNKIARIIVYSHRLIMAAEQLKQDIQLGKIQRPNIYTHTHFQEIWEDIYRDCDAQTIQESFWEFYETMKNTDEHIRKNRVDEAIQTLNLFKSALEK